MDRTYSTADYLDATSELGVDKAIYMEVDVQDEQRETEAEFIIDLCQRDDNPTCAAVLSGGPSRMVFAPTSIPSKPLHTSKESARSCIQILRLGGSVWKKST